MIQKIVDFLSKKNNSICFFVGKQDGVKNTSNIAKLLLIVLVLSLFILYHFVYDYKSVDSTDIINTIHEIESNYGDDEKKMASFVKLLTHNYTKQQDYLNKWFTIIGIILTILSVILPLFFIAMYEQHRAKLDEILKKVNLELRKIAKFKSNVMKDIEKNRKRVLITEKIIKIKQYIEIEKYDLARELAHEVREIDGESIDGLYYLGVIYAKQKNFLSCIDICRDGLKNDKYNLELITLLSYAYSHAGRTEDSVDLLEDALKKHPKDLYMMRNLSHNYNDLGMFKESIELISSLPSWLITKLPANAYNIAKAYILSDDLENGFEFLSIYCELTEKPKLDDGDFELLSSKLAKYHGKTYTNEILQMVTDMNTKK